MNYLNHEYQDRGMKKWAGFYLSEHSAIQETEELDRNQQIHQKPQMSEEEINQVLLDATTYQKLVRIQVAEIINGQYLPDIVGFYRGSAEEGFYIDDSLLRIEEIHHISVEEPIKWSNVNYQVPIWDKENDLL